MSHIAKKAQTLPLWLVLDKYFFSCQPECLAVMIIDQRLDRLAQTRGQVLYQRTVPDAIHEQVAPLHRHEQGPAIWGNNERTYIFFFSVRVPEALARNNLIGHEFQSEATTARIHRVEDNHLAIRAECHLARCIREVSRRPFYTCPVQFPMNHTQGHASTDLIGRAV